MEATTQILENIKLHKRLIQEKTEVGRSLSAHVSESMRMDQFEKEQRYELFINKMQRLYKNERNFETKKKKAFKAMAFSTLTSTKPL